MHPRKATIVNLHGWVSLPQHLSTLVVLLVLLVPLCASAQEVVSAGAASKSSSAANVVTVTLEKGTKIKLKSLRKLSSGTVRKWDYVPFEVAEDVIAFGADEEKPQVAIPKGTPAFGIV